MKQEDILVIGGGLAGLTASIYLAQAGRSVTLLEKAKNMGGRAQTQQKGGFSFNLGPHALYQGGLASEILNELNIHVQGKEPSIDGLALYQGDLFPLLTTPKGFFTSKLLTAKEKFTYARQIVSAMRVEPESQHHLTVQAWIQNLTSDIKLQQLWQSISRLATYSNALDQLSAMVFLRQFQSSLRASVLYIDGGWQTLVEQLRQKAILAGVNIQINASVHAIHQAHHHPIVELKNGDTWQTTAVLLTTPPQTLKTLLPNIPLPNISSVQAACLDVALNQLPQPHHRFALGIDQPLYYSLHSATADLAPKGGALIHVAKYLSTQAMEDDKTELVALLNQLQPNWQAHCVHERYLPQMTVIQHGWNAGEERPSVNPSQYPNIYLAGDWVGDEGWLAEASFASARQSAQHLLQHSPATITERPLALNMV